MHLNKYLTANCLRGRRMAVGARSLVFCIVSLSLLKFLSPETDRVNDRAWPTATAECSKKAAATSPLKTNRAGHLGEAGLAWRWNIVESQQRNKFN